MSEASTGIDDELRVAYLDGELSSEDVTLVESQLRADESMRIRLENLRVTGEMLLDLPEPKPNVDLARSTIEIVAIDLENERRNSLLGRLRANWPLALLTGMVVLFNIFSRSFSFNLAKTTRIF